MKALVVGGTGPTGPLVVEGLLSRGYEVTLLHRGVHEVEFSAPVEHVHADPHFVETLQKAIGDRRFDLCAAMYGRLRHVAAVMRGHTDRLIAAAGQPYLAFVHGIRSAGGAPVPVGEDAPLCLDESINRPAYLMAISEQAVIESHRQGYYKGTVFRYPWVYGPRQLAPREWCLVRRYLDGRRRLIVPNEGLTLVSRGYSENMAHAFLLAVDNAEKAAGQTYNVADERSLSLREWAAIVGEALNWEWELTSLPSEIARPSRPYAGRDHHQVMDISKIKAELGYRDVFGVEEGLRRTVAHYLKNPPQLDKEEDRARSDVQSYEVEDRLIEEYRKQIGALREISDVGYRYHHAYPHPTAPTDYSS